MPRLGECGMNLAHGSVPSASGDDPVPLLCLQRSSKRKIARRNGDQLRHRDIRESRRAKGEEPPCGGNKVVSHVAMHARNPDTRLANHCLIHALANALYRGQAPPSARQASQPEARGFVAVVAADRPQIQWLWTRWDQVILPNPRPRLRGVSTGLSMTLDGSTQKHVCGLLAFIAGPPLSVSIDVLENRVSDKALL